MSETPIIGFRLVGVNTTEAGKAASANENALIAEALFKQRVESRSTSAPPSSPSNGDVYIVPDASASPAPSGAWAGHEDEIAIYYNGWLFVAPINGPVFYVADEDLSVKYDDTASPPAWVVGGASTFIGQSDTPASYSGQAGKAALVNSGETGLEFGDAGGGTWALVDEHDFAGTPASELIVTGVDVYSEVVVIANGLGAASIGFVRAHFSTDGGSTWLTTSGDYQVIAVHITAESVGDNDEAFMLNSRVSNANGGIARFSVAGMGQASVHTSWSGASGHSSGDATHEDGFATVAAVHDAIRFQHDSGNSDLNAGSIHVYGR